VIACSGGLDSTVLARLAVPLLRAAGVRVTLAHLDHGLRGRSAVADADAVSALAVELAAPLVRRTQVPDRKVRQELGLQAAAREVRRSFLRDIAAGFGATQCLLGHHEDDQVETLQIQQSRGRRRDSRCGISAQSGLFTRPWIGVPRAVLESVAKREGWSWRMDPSNNDPRFLRARIRSEPPLSPSMRSGLLGQALNARARRTYVHDAAMRCRDSVVTRTDDGRHVLDRGELCSLEVEVALALLQRLTPTRGRRPPSRAALQGLLACARSDVGGEQRRVALGGGWAGRCAGDDVEVSCRSVDSEPVRPSVAGARVALSVARALLRPGDRWGRGFAVFDGQVLDLSPRIAPAGVGRRIALYGGGGRRLVRDVLADAGVPRSARARWPIVQSCQGNVLWVPGARRSAHHPLTDASVDAYVLYTVAPQKTDPGNREWSL